MKHLKPAVLLLGLAALDVCAAGHVDSVSIEVAKRFLHQYAEQSYLQSAQITELYSDRAVVRMYGPRQSTERRLLGRSYKLWLRERLQARDIALDASQFKDVRLERRGGRLVIHANRYAANRCYWDPGYLVGLEREEGRWLVVDEAITTQPRAQCSLASQPAIAATSKTPHPAPSMNAQMIANSQAASASPSRNVILPPSLPPSAMVNESTSLQTASLAQRAAEARAIAQQMAASYGQAGTAAPDAIWVQRATGGLGAAYPLGRSGANLPAGEGRSLWVTPE